MPTKQQYDKAAWDWAASTENVTEEHVHTAYRINLKPCKSNSCRRNCRGNPHCLVGLGEKNWMQDIADEDWHEIDDPNAERREKDCFVGLKNLGATCYVNSFLQVWYHNPAFRKIVYEWEPKDDPQECDSFENSDKFEPVSCIGQLQLIFALLQFSSRKYIDPTPFINSLGLCTTQQQDAQEFCKLFISLLEDKFSYQSDSSVRNVVQQQYSGEYAYVTRCHKCQNESMRQSQFYELDLNIKGHKDLYESLEEFMQEEKLEGSNQYLCGHCQEKQNASRSIRLLRMPPTLHLQLLRFVFDRQSGSKKKLNSFIRFSEVLDMSKYLQQPENSVVYHLSAVLIHRGPSAYSGHYVAHIRDRVTGSWYKFNDETVEKMEGKKLQLGSEENLPDDISIKASTNKAPKVSKGNHCSNNAYMMVYKLRVPDRPEMPPDDSDQWNLPEHLRRAIATDNEKFEDWVNELAVMREQNVATGKARQMEIREIYDKLPSPSGDSDCEWISTSWLSKWLMGDLTNVPLVDNSFALCSHEMLDPSAVDKMKCISKEAADLIYCKYGGGPRVRNILCHKCVESQCRLIGIKAKLLRDQKIFASLLKAKIAPGDPSFWVGKLSLRNWRSMVLREFEGCNNTDAFTPAESGGGGAGGGDDETSNNEDTPEAEQTCGSNDEEETAHLAFNEDVLCEHKNLQIDEGCRRLIRTEAWELLKNYFPDAPEFAHDALVCRSCLVQRMEDMQHKDFLRIVAQDQKALLADLYGEKNRPCLENVSGDHSSVFYLLSKSFVDKWRRFIREPSRRDPVKELENCSLLCEHGGLLYSPDLALGKDSSQSPLMLVWENEWMAILQTFSVDVEVKVTVTRDQLTKVETNPSVCEKCYLERLEQEHLRLLDFNNAKIYVRRVSKLDEELQSEQHNSSAKDTSDDSDLAQSAKKRKTTEDLMVESAGDVRRSSRRRKQRGEKELTVSAYQTLRDLKVQIMKHFSVAPYDQHLSLDGRRLTDNQASLASLNVLPGSLILLQADEVAEEAIVMEDYLKATAPETGFKGTELQRC